jgi:plastocyanin
MFTVRRLFFLVVGLIILAALPAGATVINVGIQGLHFVPADITVSQGDTVIWTNDTGVTHNVHHTGTPSQFGNDLGTSWTYLFPFDLPPARYDYVCQLHASMGMVGSVTVEPLAAPEPVAAAPVNQLTLAQNYPNPFNGQTNIEFWVPHATSARLIVLNVLGQQVAEPFKGPVAAGQHHVVFDASGLSTGLYFYRLEADHAFTIRTMDYVK